MDTVRRLVIDIFWFEVGSWVWKVWWFRYMIERMSWRFLTSEIFSLHFRGNLRIEHLVAPCTLLPWDLLLLLPRRHNHGSLTRFDLLHVLQYLFEYLWLHSLLLTITRCAPISCICYDISGRRVLTHLILNVFNFPLKFFIVRRYLFSGCDKHLI